MLGHPKLQQKSNIKYDEDDEENHLGGLSSRLSHEADIGFINRKKQRIETESDLEAEEEELKEQVGDLPPKIEDL